MSIPIEKFLARPIKKIVKPFLKYAPVNYARRAATLYFIKVFKAQPAKYRADTAPLMESFSRYEVLFRNSEKNFEATVAPYIPQFKWFIGRIYNGAFESIDVELYLYLKVAIFQSSITTARVGHMHTLSTFIGRAVNLTLNFVIFSRFTQQTSTNTPEL